MPPEDHHSTPHEIQRCPICQLLYRLRAMAIVERIRNLAKRGKS